MPSMAWCRANEWHPLTCDQVAYGAWEGLATRVPPWAAIRLAVLYFIQPIRILRFAPNNSPFLIFHLAEITCERYCVSCLGNLANRHNSDSNIRCMEGIFQQHCRSGHSIRYIDLQVPSSYGVNQSLISCCYGVRFDGTMRNGLVFERGHVPRHSQVIKPGFIRGA